jgi:hypothetical protein
MADWYAGHELAHTFGLEHVETTTCALNAGSPFDPYDYPEGRIGGPAGDSNRYYGFDTFTREIYDGPDWIDVMTYCRNIWISDITHNRLLNAISDFTASALMPEAPLADDHLLLFGEVDYADETGQIDVLYRLPDAVASPPSPTGTHSIRLLDASYSILATHFITPSTLTDELSGETNLGLIGVTVPWISGTQHVAVYSGTSQLDLVTASPNRPTVTLVAPNGGETLAGTSTVTWSGSDIDGDPLTYAVQYRKAAAAAWQTLAASIANTTTFSLDTAYLPGGSQAQLRILASDGVNTAIDISDDVFTVPLKAPEVTLISPISDSVYLPTQSFNLVGAASDREDGSLDDPALSWSTPVSGTLGSGKMVNVTGLPVGAHEITLTATDSDGYTGTASVPVRVCNPVEFITVTATVSGADTHLNWTHPAPGNVAYQVHRGDAPYFQPISTTALITLTAPVTSFVDAGAAAMTTPSYYRVRALGCDPVLHVDSPAVGLFPFPLVPGSAGAQTGVDDTALVRAAPVAFPSGIVLVADRGQ